MFTGKVAIIVDWLIDFGGAELVISHLLEIYPEADIFTSVCYMDHPMLEGRRVYTSWIQRIPFFNRKHKLAGILRPWAFRSFDLSEYDIIISSSSAESKNAGYSKRKPGAKYFCYCHTPTRYYWSHAKEYEDMMEFGVLNPLVKAVFRLVKGWMQRVDYAAAQRVDYFIANSRTTAGRIQKYYDRESEVIYPGVSVPRHPDEGRIQYRDNDTLDSSYPRSTSNASQKGAIQNDGNKDGYYLGMSRCIPYKRLDLLVDAFNESGKSLILVTNTDNLLYRELKERSKGNITWVFNPEKDKKMNLYRRARAFLFPPEEDFGLVPIEAMMCGTPVIAYGVGGATESVIDGETGLFFTPQAPEALNAAIEKFETLEWDKNKIRARGVQFSKEKFQENIRIFIESHAA